MDDSIRDLLVRGVAAAKAGDAKEARFFLEWAAGSANNDTQRIEAWYWLSEISTDAKEKRDLLSNVLAANPLEPRARRALAVLDGRLKAEEIIDPDRLAAAQSGVDEASSRRFICPTCGGKMTFAADGVNLMCEFCEGRQRLRAANQPAGIEEQDFVLAMATARGHRAAVRRHIFSCQGCGATYLLPPNRLTMSCPYCEASHVVDLGEKEWFEPSAVIPFQINEKQARELFKKWLDEFRPPEEIRISGIGIYLPVWSFEIGGEIRWSAEVTRNRKTETITGRRSIAYRSVLVSAIQENKLFREELSEYRLDGLQPFEEGYLANWLAESYEELVGDASLDARKIAADQERRNIQSDLGMWVSDLKMDTASMAVEAFQYLLFPAWLIHYSIGDERYAVLINGQTGHLRGERPPGAAEKFLRSIFG